MKVKDLIAKLGEYNPEAEMGVIVHNQREEFTLSYGGRTDGEGTTKETTTGVGIYVDRLNQGERDGIECDGWNPQELELANVTGELRENGTER